MEERIIVSGEQGLSAYAMPPADPLTACRLRGTGAVCVGQNTLYAADNYENVIWYIDAKTLIPKRMFSGGPGISQMMLSKDGKHLYALCAEADSLLMLCACSGTPKRLCRVGVNPCAMAMDESGNVLAVAGGACGEVFLLNAHSLLLNARLSTCGMVFSVAVCKNCVYALSLTETMDSVLTVFLPDSSKRELPLPGMPGTLSTFHECILAATHQSMYLVPRDASAISRRISVPGRAGRLCVLPDGLLMMDLWTEGLFWRRKGTRCWRCIAQGVKDAAYLKLIN